jgi:TRAP-type mannitol/chloroaromatic compound transport system permease small subunit
MPRWLRFARGIDRLNEWIGRITAWAILLMVVLGAYNASMRHLGRSLGVTLSSNAYIELQWYLFSLVFLLGTAYTLAHNAHVRVDVFYSRLSSRRRAWVNLCGTVLFLLPFAALMFLLAWPSVLDSWAVREVSPDPGGLPRYPLKAAVLVAFALVGVQGLAEIIKNVAILKGSLAEIPEEREAV